MSNDNISPIHRRSSPAGCSASDRQQRVLRPASGRSAMDLYAAIHESKKRLLGSGQQQQPTAVTVQKAPLGRDAAVTVTAVRRRRQQQLQPAAVERDRYRPRGDDRSAARYDFKRLLLQTNMAGGRRAQQSAVVRLQQPVAPPSRLVTCKSSSTPTSSWKSNVLSSTIQEDCREDENYCCTDDVIGTNGTGSDGVVPKSTALVNRTLRGLAAAATSCSALETAL